MIMKYNNRIDDSEKNSHSFVKSADSVALRHRSLIGPVRSMSLYTYNRILNLVAFCNFENRG